MCDREQTYTGSAKSWDWLLPHQWRDLGKAAGHELHRLPLLTTTVHP